MAPEVPDQGQLPEGRFGRLLAVGAELLSELDLESVLRSVVEAARELTASRYAALGVLNPQRTELERFIYLGIDDATKRAIGNLPRGRGVLGELIREPSPLRLRDVNEHPHAYGYPPGHPSMRSFLGVPISVRGEVFGNLYMTEKRGAAEFSETDEEAARILAGWAGIAIENARLYTSLSEREAELQQALRGAETSVDIARTVGGETDVGRVLDLIVKRARALVEARGLLLMLRRGEQLYVAASAGRVGGETARLTVPVGGSLFGDAMAEQASVRLDGEPGEREFRLRERLGAEAGLVVPLLFRGYAVGVLVALDREGGDGGFGNEDSRLLAAFAASAATAVATAQTVQAERLQQQVEIGERERRRWAQELHDDTLQGLAAIRISLASALASGAEDRGEGLERVAAQTVARLEAQIADLTRLINDLRPAALERHGLRRAIEELLGEASARDGIEVESELRIGDGLTGEEERIVYRLIQEALTNVGKHAAAGRVLVTASHEGEVVRIAVIDDGRGFDPDAVEGGHGLLGMRERVESVGGEIEVRSEPAAGTTVRARIPVSGS